MPFRTPPGNPNAVKRSRTPPPEDTFEEASFLKALGEKQKPVNIKLMDGQTVRGWVEYYDKNMVRLTREGAPNLFIFKHEIMYIMEDSGKQKYPGSRCPPSALSSHVNSLFSPSASLSSAPPVHHF